ncbi:hypothetical protein DYB37_001023 [Aphanomyces astaci]|uniref:Holocytochrome c-type synthase n=1 Tax=Aphanomyces astaci TaxID=112090 RepID=A0A3R7A6L9_APHAT|nr:hypothetical protein DYB35_001090 [Aphanomyces astaci]RHZ23059.1 hypothetical protein DYB37_001023 [Aphanomyces astaci]
MGNTSSTPAVATPLKPTAQEGCPVKHSNVAPEGCPVKHSGNTTSVVGEGCPVVKKQKVYNVYSQEIDPTNNMPSNPNQEPNDGQKYPLNTTRVTSTIPKGGTDGTWTYPSEQMFFNALRRKGKGEDVHEGHVQTIVSIHNNMNERAWNQVAAWEEALHPGYALDTTNPWLYIPPIVTQYTNTNNMCRSDSKLLRFCGRPDDLTPIARLKTLFGFVYDKPFDRHDWVVVRNDNTEQRYVIDYYFDDDKAAEDAVPRLHDVTSVKSITMYARPAVDSLSAVVDRIKFPLLNLLGPAPAVSFPPPPPSDEADASANSDDLLTVDQVNATFGQIQANCSKCFTNVQTCADEVACTQAATALQFCMANILCKPDAVQFTAALASGDEGRIEEAYAAMGNCVDRFEVRSRAALQQQALEAARKVSAAAQSP